MNLHRTLKIAAATLLIAGALPAAPSFAATSLLNVSYDPTRVFPVSTYGADLRL